MLRIALLILLLIFLARAFWRVVDGIIEGVTGRPRSRSPRRGAQMVRDPVCGTFVVADRALSLTDSGTTVHFCSDACRDKYKRTSRSGRTA